MTLFVFRQRFRKLLADSTVQSHLNLPLINSYHEKRGKNGLILAWGSFQPSFPLVGSKRTWARTNWYCIRRRFEIFLEAIEQNKFLCYVLVSLMYLLPHRIDGCCSSFNLWDKQSNIQKGRDIQSSPVSFLLRSSSNPPIRRSTKR